MPPIALAYSIEDQSSARMIADDLSTHVDTEFFGVEAATGKAILAGMLDTFTGPIVLLLSDNFLKNANCIFGLKSIIDARKDVVPVFISSRSYDETAEEVVVTQVDLRMPHFRETYGKYWKDQYRELLGKVDNTYLDQNLTFRHHLERIHSIRDGIDELLSDLGSSTPVTEDRLEQDHYKLLFAVLDAPELYRDYAKERNIRLAAIPGMGDLPETFSEGAAAGAVDVEDEQAEEVEPEAREEPNLTVSSSEESTSAAVKTAAKDASTEIPSPISVRGESSGYELDVDTQAEVWISRAWSLYEQGETEDGLSLLAGGREALPDHPDVAYNYALMLAMDTEAPRVALMEVQKLLEEFHDHAGALFLSGELSLLAGDYSGANLDWLQLRDVDPLYPDLNYRLGVLIGEHFPERSSEALTYLRRASRDEPLNGDARYRYAMMLYTQLGSEKKAIKWLKRAIDVTPDHAPAHYALATLMHKRGKLTAARNAYRTAVHFDSAYDTPTNRIAFAQKVRMKSDSSNRGDKALRRLKERIAELESELESRETSADPTSTAPAAAPTAPRHKPGTGKIAFISGATSGIGRATAYALAEDGYNLILLGRRTERLEELRDDFEQLHDTTSMLITVDIRDRTQLIEALNELPDEWQAVDLLINNAGKAKGFDPIQAGAYEHWDEMIDVNLKGLLTLTREITPWMVKRQSGTIINVCSTAGKEVYPNGNVYCATKHAVDALTYAMRLDLVKHGIRVGQICPAHVEETEFAVVRFDGDEERAKIYEDFQPLRSSDVAKAVRFMVNQPAHVNIMDLVLQGTQQASSTVVDRSGRDKFSPR